MVNIYKTILMSSNIDNLVYIIKIIENFTP